MAAEKVDEPDRGVTAEKKLMSWGGVLMVKKC